MSRLRRPPHRVLVVGLGNPHCGDDGVGALVVRRLAGRLPPDVEVRTRNGDVLDLLDDWDGFGAVVCIDAAAMSEMPGCIHRIDYAPDKFRREVALASSHALGLGQAIELARALDPTPREIIVYAIEGSCFEIGKAPSAEVTAAASVVAELIVAEVARLQAPSKNRAVLA